MNETVIKKIGLVILVATVVVGMFISLTGQVSFGFGVPANGTIVRCSDYARITNVYETPGPHYYAELEYSKYSNLGYEPQTIEFPMDSLKNDMREKYILIPYGLYQPGLVVLLNLTAYNDTLTTKDVCVVNGRAAPIMVWTPA